MERVPYLSSCYRNPVLSRLLAISQVASQPTLTQEGKLKLAIADLFI